MPGTVTPGRGPSVSHSPREVVRVIADLLVVRRRWPAAQANKCVPAARVGFRSDSVAIGASRSHYGEDTLAPRAGTARGSSIIAGDGRRAADAPALTIDEALELARRLFGVTATGRRFPASAIRTSCCRPPTGDRFVLKIANATDDRALARGAERGARARRAAHRALPARRARASTAPRSPRSRRRRASRHFVRLLTWVAGVPLGSVPDHAAGAARGSRRARRASSMRALDGFDHPAIHRDFYWDLAQRPADSSASWRRSSRTPAMRALVTRVADRIEARDAPRFARLRRAAVHNDPNDYNVLVSPASAATITGILDFGDIVHSYAIADLAIAIAYAVLGKADPLAAAVVGRPRLPATSVRSTTTRSASLFGLVLLRLCTSVCVAARQQRQRPGRRVSVDQPGADRADAAGAGGARSRRRSRRRSATRAARRRRRRWRRAGASSAPICRSPTGTPVKIVRGWMQYLYDDDRPPLPRRLQQRAARRPQPPARRRRRRPSRCCVLNTNTRYLHDSLAAFAERAHRDAARRRSASATSSTPAARPTSWRCAWRARTRAGATSSCSTPRITATRRRSSTSARTSSTDPAGKGAPPWVHVLPLPDTYRGKYQARRSARRREVRRVRAARPATRARFIAESAPSVGGQIILPDRLPRQRLRASSAPPAASASPTKCRPRTAGWARTSTRSRRSASSPTSSCSGSRSATAIRSARW